MEQKILYFGYGANRDPKMMEWITGNKDLVGKPGILKGYALCIQRKDQVPDEVSITAPAPLSARQLLDNWPETFESYNIKKDSTGEVYGTVWVLTPQDRELVRDWELIDFGWYKDIATKVQTEEGQILEVQTEGMREDQQFDREVDGKNYETWLQPPEDFKRIATRSREEYFARIEGSTKTPEKVL